MLNLVLYTIIIGSLLGILIILGRKIPALAQLSENEVAILRKKRGILRKTAVSIKKIDYDSYKKGIARTSKIGWQFVKKGLTCAGNYLKIALRWTFIKLKALGRIIGRGFVKLGRIIKSIFGNLVSGTRGKLSDWQKARTEEQKIQAQEEDKEEDDESFDIKRVSADYFEPSLKEETPQISEADIIEAELADKKTSVQLKKEKVLDLSELEKPLQEEQEIIDIIVKNPKNIIAYKALGLFYYKQRNYKDAKASLKTAIKLGSSDKNVQEVLDDIEKKTNNGF